MDEIINTRLKEFSKDTDLKQTIALYLIAFLTPLLLGLLLNLIFPSDSFVVTHAQIIIGSIVNTALIVSAINMKGWAKIGSVVTMPSIATILSGFVFKTSSIYMVYMIPGIWLGNFALVYSYKYFLLKKKYNYLSTSIIGISFKVAVIFLIFSMLRLLGVFPEILVSTLRNAMSLTQLITASIGALISYYFYINEYKSLNKKKKKLK